MHKDTIATAEAGKRNALREHSNISNSPTALKGSLAKLAPGGSELRLCCEAGPCT